MIRVNGHITLSSKQNFSLNERKLKQNTHLKQDFCSGFRKSAERMREQDPAKLKSQKNSGIKNEMFK